LARSPQHGEVQMTLGRFFPLPIVALVVASTAVYACSAVGNGSEFGQGGAGGTAADGVASLSQAANSSSGDGVFDAGSPTSGSGGPGCSVEAQYVYTVDGQNMLYKFDPPTRNFTPIGKLNCALVPGQPYFATPYSMGVSRDATAWVVYTDGNLFQVDTKSA